MKKTTVLALGLAFVGVLCLSSCMKECSCTTKMDGEVVSETTVEHDGNRCSELNVTNDESGLTSSITCI